MLTGQLAVGARVARWWFTDRMGGCSLPPFDGRNLAAHVGDDITAVRRNRDELEARLAVGALSWMGPVHGTAVHFLTGPAVLTPNVDALATTHSRQPLVTLGADCVPLLLVADDLVMAAHIGWRGFVDGMTESLLRVLTDHGAAVERATVLLGPAICGDCYAVPPERADAIAAVSAAAIRRARNGDPGADIRDGLIAQWTEHGAAVHRIGPCTFEDMHYFSHRRDGVTGRQAGVIVWT